MATCVFIARLAVLLIATVVAADQSPLQDFCVADPSNIVQVNGLACKEPKMVQADDFLFGGLHLAGNTSNAVRSRVTPVTVAQLLGLNTLGVALLRINFTVGGLNPPHSPSRHRAPDGHQGSLEVRFITSIPDDRLISKVLSKGDVFVFPQGLIHFQRNVGKMNAIAVSAFNSQNPGMVATANGILGSMPDIATDVHARAFRVDKNLISQIQSKF